MNKIWKNDVNIRNFFLCILIVVFNFVFFFIVIDCDGSPGTTVSLSAVSSEEADVNQFSILSTLPNNNEEGVSPFIQNVQITFSHPIKIDTGSVVFQRDSDPVVEISVVDLVNSNYIVVSNNTIAISMTNLPDIVTNYLNNIAVGTDDPIYVAQAGSIYKITLKGIVVNGSATDNTTIENYILSFRITNSNDENSNVIESKGTISALLIGNSLMNGVEAKLDSLLTIGGYDHETTAYNPGGYSLYQHSHNSPTTAHIADAYDLVLLQEQSAGIHWWHSEPYPVIASLQTKIQTAGSKMVFYQTWGYSGMSPDAHIAGYDNAGAFFNAPVIAIGRAWKDFYDNYPHAGFSLYSDDRHASTHGQHLIAYVLYAYLTEENPINLSQLSLSSNDALILQTISWDTYQAYP